MAITRWSPFNELTNLHTTMDRLFGDMFEGGADWRGLESATYRLPIDVTENDDSYTIKAPVPGVKPEDVEVTISGNTMSIKAKHSEEKTSKKGNYLRREMVVGNFERQIALPSDVRAENINATFDNGVLKIEVPRSARPKPQRVEVRSESQKQMAGTGSRS